ncbi:hypothetical protein K7A41_06390 [Sphingobacterium sp. InxBP1]|uniref:TlpA family protein disulfide reductase n=1 Tax=Sphingobacterium sp. InxBP1 TaxID=2870328 RepID=UPI002242F0B6|nr:hypothetical protein [Sphingobacterium sp. InxBP1]MCW8310845.1 hypothetical protein [Sphingobacterium sp. InxBP1]
MRQFFGAGEVLPSRKTMKLYSTLLSILWFSMFSLSAQTPRKDGGADGLRPKKQVLRVGSSVPEDFWTRKHLFFRNGDTISETLEKYKGKILVLDFWYIGCRSCLLDQKEIAKAKKKYKDRLSVIMVNNLPNWDNIDAFRKFYFKERYRDFGMDEFESIIYDNYLYDLFDSFAYPMYVWINEEGAIRTITGMNL